MKKIELNAAFDNRDLVASNIQECTGISFKTWCKFTGLFCRAFPSGFISTSEIKLTGKYPFFWLLADIREKVELRIKFDLETKTISNYTFILFSTGMRRGTHAMMTQVNLATYAGFEKLECSAIGNGAEFAQYGGYFHGYITWGKMGFTMQPEDQKQFEEFMVTKRSEKRLHELLKTKQGEFCWTWNGWEWDGEFALYQGSINRNIFNSYFRSHSLR